MNKYLDFGDYEHTRAGFNSTGYEDHYDKLKEIGENALYAIDCDDVVDDDDPWGEVDNSHITTVVGYIDKTQEEKDAIVDSVLDIYCKNENHNGSGIFPIVYFNESGISLEITKCEKQGTPYSIQDDTVDFSAPITSNLIDKSPHQGGNLGRFLFPNMFKVVCKGSKNTMHYKFYDEHTMRRTIDFCLRFKDGQLMPSNIRGGLEMIGGNVATNFKPMLAKTIFEKYCEFNGTIYDFSCGFGGRMLGALTSDPGKYKYRGCEPCTETFSYLKQQGEYLDKYAQNGKMPNRWEIICQGSELELPAHWIGTCDFAFSSPPYFDLEQYSGEETQCYVQYPDLESWFEGYVRPTIKNIHAVLKDGCKYAVNIADFKLGSKTIEFVDKWLEISEELGFEQIEEIKMKLQRRVGAGHKEGEVIKEKKEGIYVFRKK